MPWGPVAIFTLLTLLPNAASAAAAKPKSDDELAVINAGVAAAEDAPFASPSYEFYPGETVYVSFEISGFHVDRKEELNTERIAIAYEVQLQDAQERPVAPPKHDAVEVQLSPEDKNWIPKRHLDFLLPSLLPAGTYQLHVAVEDTLAHTHSSRMVAFRVGGEHILPSAGLSIQHFAFLRTGDGGKPLEVAAYRPGNTVFVAFDLAGFAVSEGNRYRLSYTIAVAAPDGKPFLKETPPVHIEDASFYPAQYLPVNLEVATTDASAPGNYTFTLSVTDLNAHQTQRFPYIFTLE